MTARVRRGWALDDLAGVAGVSRGKIEPELLPGEDGISVIEGNAAMPTVLARTNLPQARVLVVAIPDPVNVRQIVELAHATAPGSTAP